MRKLFLAGAAALLAVGSTLSCDRKQPLAPETTRWKPLFFTFGDGTVPPVVISQIYGGGGNTGAPLKNDFVELFNPGTVAVSLAGWSVQYASATGSSWQVTNLSGSIQPGGYYLVQEAAGTGIAPPLPTPDAMGTIAMAQSAGKVALVQSITALSGTCPTGSVIDRVSFGTTATNCVPFGTTANISNTTAAIRKAGGCAYTGSLGADFDVLAPAPRNSASPTHSCSGGPAVRVKVTPNPTLVSLGATQTFAAEAKDADSIVVYPTITWSSADTTIAKVSASGVATARALGTTTVTATTSNGVSDAATITVTPPAIHWIDLSSSADSFPPGFQTQLFATARIGSGGLIVPATFTFEALDPDIATIALVQNTGIITGVSASATKPRFKITATPLDGASPPYTFTTTAGTAPVKIVTPVSAPASIYAVNDEFGDPTAASSSNPNDLLIVRPQYTLSYNETRGTPNWVSYELDTRQFGAQDRCDCFTADPLLPVDKQILTSDYTNGGYNRGHMARSFDRTAGNTDNAATFYLTNIVPQTGDLNSGVWAKFENDLGDSATKGGRAVYIITGPLYSRSHGLTFLKNEGKVAVPDSTWKVALIGPVGGGVPFARGNVQSWTDLPGVTVLAVNMPNVSGVLNDPWSKYQTTVDKIETATGYDFLSLLPVAFQTALEAGDHPPVASFAFSGTPNEGSVLAFDASASTDPDLGRTDMDPADVLSYAWSFGDGSTGTGVGPSKTFGQYGIYNVTLTVSDAYGWPAIVTHSVTIANVPPVVAPIAGATLLPGETYAFAGSFTDPGTDTWTASVNYGDGSGSQPLALEEKTFQLSHRYASAGTFTVAVIVGDGAAAGTASATVVVLAPVQGIAVLTDAIATLGGSGGPLEAGEMNSLRAKLNAAAAACRRDSPACANILGAFVNEMNALVNSGRVDGGVAAPLISYAERLIASLGA